MDTLQAPFPWFGGKSRAAELIWTRFGNVPNYVEPFAGSLAVLLGRPHAPQIETVNDKDGFIANFWRALQADPAAVAQAADWPVNENDLHARHSWLVRQRVSLTARLEGDPHYYDATIAGWWVWGICCWIGGGWCSGDGPWRVDDTGQLVVGNAGLGVRRRRVHLGNAGLGVHRQLRAAGQGPWFAALAARLRRVRVCCGEWTRVCGPTPTTKLGITGVVLDPPYGYDANRDNNLYAVDSGTVAAEARAWAIARGDDPLFRIALCGYDTEHSMPTGWTVVQWRAGGGYANQGRSVGVNAARETVWFSPHCLDLPLFMSSVDDD